MTHRKNLLGLLLTTAIVTPVGALAQQAAEPVPAPPPAATAPPATVTPPAPTTTAPAQPAANGAAPAADAQKQLPEVEVIQQKPTPPAQQAEPAKPKTKPVAQQTPPAPQPAATPGVVAAPASTQPPTLAPVGPPPGDTPVNMSPAGGAIPLDKVPGSVSRVTAADIGQDGLRQPQNVLNQLVPGIILSDTAGGGLRTDIQYRGFDASPIGGRSQGLAVYQNGVRINEAFGDTVNLDLIPAIAINDIMVLSNNPVYGLNAIGGAIGITMKDGFTHQGATIDIMGGSFGRKQIAVEYGAQSGTVGAYVAAEAIEDDGFRRFLRSRNSPILRRPWLQGQRGRIARELECREQFSGCRCGVSC